MGGHIREATRKWRCSSGKPREIRAMGCDSASVCQRPPHLGCTLHSDESPVPCPGDTDALDQPPASWLSRQRITCFPVPRRSFGAVMALRLHRARSAIAPSLSPYAADMSGEPGHVGKRTYRGCCCGARSSQARWPNRQHRMAAEFEEIVRAHRPAIQARVLNAGNVLRPRAGRLTRSPERGAALPRGGKPFRSTSLSLDRNLSRGRMHGDRLCSAARTCFDNSRRHGAFLFE